MLEEVQVSLSSGEIVGRDHIEEGIAAFEEFDDLFNDWLSRIGQFLLLKDIRREIRKLQKKVKDRSEKFDAVKDEYDFALGKFNQSGRQLKFFADNTKMLFGDGQKAASELIQAVKEL